MDFSYNKYKDFLFENFKIICPNGAIGCSDNIRKGRTDYKIFYTLNELDELFSDEKGELYGIVGNKSFLIKGMTDFGRMMLDRAGYSPKDVYEDTHFGVTFSCGKDFEKLFLKK